MNKLEALGIRLPFLTFLSLALALNLALTWYVVGVMRFPISSDRDSFEYVGITDNLLAGHGFAVEPNSPWRPDGSRTPGMLLINLPLRVFSEKNDLSAALAGRLALLSAALVVGILGVRVLGNAYGWLACCFLLITPSIVYYTINPYETELHYLLALSLLFFGISLTSTHRAAGVIVATVSSAYAMLLRPAALFVLLTIIVVLLLSILFLENRNLKMITLVLAAGIMGGTVFAYGGWSARNYLTFGALEFSTVGGYNLLHYNAAGMRPYLDPSAADEVSAALAANPVIVQRNYSVDQFRVAAAQGKAGLALIEKYPIAFARSHLDGSWRALLLFDVSVLKNRFGLIPLSVLTAFQILLSFAGFLGISLIWRRAPESVRLLLVILLASGLVSVFTSGVLASPRFRFPLEIAFAVGLAEGVAWMKTKLDGRRLLRRI